jgi:flavin reductase (DIM6/NTAB) family NADH-FMN oxidoreductase RutF
MEYAPHEVSMYRTLSAAVTPRPIAWVGTTSPDGVDNLAPFSYFTVVCIDPPVIAFAPMQFQSGLKDTPRNILDSEEFVVNVVVDEQVEKMNATSASLEESESEFEHAGVESAACTVVDAPRVADAPVSLECRLYDTVSFPTSTLVLGEVVHVHADESVLTDGKLDVRKVDTVGRLAGGYYARTSDRFELERPE